MSDSPNYTWLVTGASRGIGAEIVRQLLQTPTYTVLAACRTPAAAADLGTNAKGTLHVLALDVADEESIKAAAGRAKQILGDGGINFIINNAAISAGSDSALAFSTEAFTHTLATNVIGPALVARSFLPLLERGSGGKKVVANVSSGLSSIGMDYGPKNATYSVSKSALNMLTYKQARERPDIVFFCLDPGWVKTDMGGAGAQLEPHESVSGILNLAHSATRESSRRFFRHNGEEIPW